MRRLRVHLVVRWGARQIEKQTHFSPLLHHRYEHHDEPMCSMTVLRINSDIKKTGDSNVDDYYPHYDDSGCS